MRYSSTRCAILAGEGAASCPARRACARLTGPILWRRHACAQSNIDTSGFRSLKEGEEVEFDLVVGEDGKKKAFHVTGPDGAPPQVGGRIKGGGGSLPALAGKAPRHEGWLGCIAMLLR